MLLKSRSRANSEAAGLDISPLIDVVFILLIFFMVSTTFVKDMKVEIERPGAASATPSSSKALRILIDSNKEIFVDGQSVRPWMLQNRIKELARLQQSDSVLIVTDRRVPAETLIEVVDQCRLAGLKDIGVATENENS